MVDAFYDTDRDIAAAAQCRCEWAMDWNSAVAWAEWPDFRWVPRRWRLPTLGPTDNCVGVSCAGEMGTSGTSSRQLAGRHDKHGRFPGPAAVHLLVRRGVYGSGSAWASICPSATRGTAPATDAPGMPWPSATAMLPSIPEPGTHALMLPPASALRRSARRLQRRAHGTRYPWIRRSRPPSSRLQNRRSAGSASPRRRNLEVPADLARENVVDLSVARHRRCLAGPSSSRRQSADRPLAATSSHGTSR